MPGMEGLFEKSKKEIYSNPLTMYVNAPWPRVGGKGKLQSGSNSKILSKSSKACGLLPQHSRISSNCFERLPKV